MVDISGFIIVSGERTILVVVGSCIRSGIDAEDITGLSRDM